MVECSSAKVKFASSVDLPFLAINQGHGSAIALGTIKNGLLIRLDNFDSIDIAADGRSARMGGGVYVDQVLATLAESNKVCGKHDKHSYPLLALKRF